MRRIIGGTAAVVVALGASGCAVGAARFNVMMTEKVKGRAAYDFNCAKEDIQVTPLDMRNFGAEGCGKRGTYVAQPAACNPETLTEQGVDQLCAAVLNSQSDAGPQGADRK